MLLNLLGVAIADEPQIVESIQKVLSKPNPTVADWQAEADSWRSDSYEKEVPDTKLPPEVPPQPS